MLKRSLYLAKTSASTSSCSLLCLGNYNCLPQCHLDYSEYIAKCDERRAFISGFDGSAGTTAFADVQSSLDAEVMMYIGCAIVTLNDAFLFTDGRYFLQAETQLDQCVEPPCRVLTARYTTPTGIGS